MTVPIPEYRDKFVAFIDILGFTKLVERSTKGEGETLEEILTALQAFGATNERTLYEQHGPTVCPWASRIERSLDFRLTQISDCVVVSAEISPAGVINLLWHCHRAVLSLLLKGLLCRGYVTRGLVFHTDTQIIGTGYQAACDGEKNGVVAFKREAEERRTPFVQIDTSIVDYVRDETDDCVREMYGRMVKSDGEVSAVFPFDRFSHTSSIVGPFDPEREHRDNDTVRATIRRLKESVQARVDPSDQKAVAKTGHYLAMLDKQLKECDEVDEMIDELTQPFPTRRL